MRCVTSRRRPRSCTPVCSGSSCSTASRSCRYDPCIVCVRQGVLLLRMWMHLYAYVCVCIHMHACLHDQALVCTPDPGFLAAVVMKWDWFMQCALALGRTLHYLVRDSWTSGVCVLCMGILTELMCVSPW